jgi:DNA-binding NarL/FixJ family response regulator
MVRGPSSSHNRPTRLLLVDDHPLVRERLAEVIQQEPDLAVCGQAEDRAGALSLARSTQPDLAIIDLTLKNSHGLDLIKDLLAERPELPILVVSMHDESLHAERALRAGARGYITKQEATRKIMLAIRTVLAGETYLSENMALRIAAKVAGRPTEPSDAVDLLTDRELRVFELIGEGHGTSQIARQLRLGTATIETYRARIKEKLNLRDANELRQQAIAWMQRGGGGQAAG